MSRKVNVKLRLESPLIIGGHRLAGNYIDTLSYIPGDRVRAALARHILLQCKFYKRNILDEKEAHKDQKYNWIEIRDPEKCKECSLKVVCENFSQMESSFFYPDNVQVLPMTTMKCKYSSTTECIYKDVLIPEINETTCKCGERLEAAGRFVKHGSNEDYRIIKVLSGKTAINRYTLAARDGSLYYINALKEGTVFSGSIKGIEKIPHDIFKTLRIGAYTSVGYGRCSVETMQQEADLNDLGTRIQNFNNNLKTLKNDIYMKVNDNAIYIPIFFVSNAKIQMDNIIDAQNVGVNGFIPAQKTEEYKNIWRKILKQYIRQGFEFEVERVISESKIYRGFDTSRKKDYLKAPCIMNMLGTSILINSKEPMDTVISAMKELQDKGIGEDRENGFGEVEVCCSSPL